VPWNISTLLCEFYVNPTYLYGVIGNAGIGFSWFETPHSFKIWGKVTTDHWPWCRCQSRQTSRCQQLYMPTEKEGNGRGWIYQHCIAGDAKQKRQHQRRTVFCDIKSGVGQVSLHGKASLFVESISSWEKYKPGSWVGKVGVRLPLLLTNMIMWDHLTTDMICSVVRWRQGFITSNSLWSKMEL
jgi:hypothetical protein